MKKIIILAVFMSMLFSCRNIVTSYSSCSGKRSESIIINYRYDPGKNKLYLVYNGAMLNCCLTKITAHHAIESNVIKVELKEHYNDPCKCVCPYTVKIAVPDVMAEKYTLEISRVTFKLDLKNDTTGEKIFKR